jgi:hypothetical protein
MYPIFFAGSIGGVIPQLLRIATLATGMGIESLPTLFRMELFCGGLLLFAIIGGVLAWALGETSIRSAFFVGIAAPALIANFINNVQDAKSGPKILAPTPSSAFSSLLVSPARADDRSDALQNKIGEILSGKLPARQGEAQPTVAITAKTEAATSLVAHICFMSKDDLTKFSDALKTKGVPELTCLDQEFIQPKQNAFTTLIVPSGALAVMVNGQLFPIDKPSLSIGIGVATAPTWTGDLLWALGGKQTEVVTSVKVEELSK